QFCGSCKVLNHRVIAQYEIQHAGEEARRLRRTAQAFGTKAGCSQEPPQPRGLARNEGERVNRHNFSGLARIRGLSFRSHLCLSVTYRLYFELSCQSLLAWRTVLREQSTK